MDRTPEPELMDDPAQAQAYAHADFSVSDQAVIDRFADLFPDGPGPSVLDLGCGPGNISFRLLERYPRAQVLGIDGSAAMLQFAEQRRQAAAPALAARLRFVAVCLPEPQLRGGHSAVLSNSLLHHLHNPQVLWQAIRQLGASGARVYVKDLRRPPSPEAAEALLQRHLTAAPPLLQRDYLASLHAAFTPHEVAQQLAQADLLGQLQVAPCDDRYLEVWGRLD